MKIENGSVRITDQIELSFSGVYTSGDGDVNYSSSFEILKLDLKEGSLFDLLEWSFHRDALYEIEGFIIRKIEEDLVGRN